MFVGPASNRGALGQVTTFDYGLLQERLKLNAASRRLKLVKSEFDDAVEWRAGQVKAL